MVEVDHGCVPDQRLRIRLESALHYRGRRLLDVAALLAHDCAGLEGNLPVKYGRCNGMANVLARWVTNHSKTGYTKQCYMRAGCGPGDRTGWRNKLLMAICVEGHVGRFAACHFGHKVSNTGLSILTDAVVVHASRRLEIDSGAFVDDFLNAIMVLSHALCAGLAGGCLMCREAAAATQSRFDSIDSMVRDCAFVFSTKGDMSVSQRHVFLGIIFDTHDGRLFVTQEKFCKLMQSLHEIMELLTCSPRGMAKLRGKAQHQFLCFEGVRPFLSLLRSVHRWA
jgi:hypothetical protein